MTPIPCNWGTLAREQGQDHHRGNKPARVKARRNGAPGKDAAPSRQAAKEQTGRGLIRAAVGFISALALSDQA